MEPTDVMDDLRTFIREKFEIDDNDPEFSDDVHLFDYGYVDSFGAVTIITFIHDRFNVEITDEDLIIHPLNTVREISALVHRRMG